MNSWIKAIMMGGILAVLTFFLYDKIVITSKPRLYDVNYTIEAILKAGAGARGNKDILGETPALIKQRLTDLGYQSVILTRHNKMEIQVKDVSDTSLILQTITRNSRIEFREVYTIDEIPTLFKTADDEISRISHNKYPSIYTLMSPLVPDETGEKIRFPAALGVTSKKDTAVLTGILANPSISKVLPPDLDFCYGILTDDNIIQNIPDDLYVYGLKAPGGRPYIQNTDIENAMLSYDPESDRPAILFVFNKNGRMKWAQLTRENTGRYLVIVLDGIVVSAPRIYGSNEKGRVWMPTRFTTAEAGKLANQLKTGMLSTDLVITSRKVSAKGIPAIPQKIFVSAGVLIIITGLAILTLKNLKNN